MKQKVVIIGHGYTSRLSLARALGMMGCEVTIVAIAFDLKRPRFLREGKPVDCCSKYVSRYFIISPDKNQLIQLLIDKCSDSDNIPVLFPDSDFSAAAVDENLNVLSQYFHCPNIGFEQGAVVRWMSKLLQKEAAREVGLNVAEASVVRVRNQQYSLPEGIAYPCFPKPLATIRGGKNGLKKCDNETELRSVVEKLSSRADLEVLVEKYMKINEEYALLGFSDGRDVVIPGIIHIKSLANGGHFGVAKTGEVLPLTGFEDLVEKFSALMKKIGYFGVFDIDFYQSGCKYYFGEINFRFGGSGYAITKMGVNLPGMMVKKMCGDSISDMNTTILNSKTFVNERMCEDDWCGGFMTSKEFNNLIHSTDISFINDEDDDMPYLKFLNNHKKDSLKRVVIKVLKRLGVR